MRPEKEIGRGLQHGPYDVVARDDDPGNHQSEESLREPPDGDGPLTYSRTPAASRASLFVR
jgi:hypothetical protein